MIKGIYHSGEGMLAQQRQMEVVANNLANASTIGFKDEQVTFKNTLKRSSFPPYRYNAGEKFVQAEQDGRMINRQGTLKQTENPLHVAIIGEGYFAVMTENGLAYTRDGRFELNGDGELVNLSGYRILTGGGCSQIPEGSIRISPQGELVIAEKSLHLERVIDQLMVVTFDNPERLRRSMDGLLVTDQKPLEIEKPSLRIGYLEESTVSVVSEMVEMIELNRDYEASAKAIQAQDQTLNKAVNEVGRVR